LSSVPVVAAVIEQDGRFLLGRRPSHKRHGDLWEFPGGKMEEGETYLAAAGRELKEELELVAESAGEVLYSAGDDGSLFVIHFVRIEARGEPVALEHTAVGWFTVEELLHMPLAPSDAQFVRVLSPPRP
jgi:8-oxo-dGTP diphosphatase